jgi:nicotinamidase/pyrazinamidase
MEKEALILIDIQNDFLPGGTLAVPHGDEVIRIANALMFSDRFDLIVATQDWHPKDHGSFAVNHPGKNPFEVVDLFGLPQVLWPAHCIQGSKGAEFAESLRQDLIQKVFTKGSDKTVDSYSGFFDNGYRNSTGMGDWLKAQDITNVTCVGLATDYCVKFTALDAKKLGFNVTVVKAGCRGVNINPDDSEKAFAEMASAGIVLV